MEGWSSDEFESYDSPPSSPTLEIEAEPELSPRPTHPVTVRIGAMMPNRKTSSERPMPQQVLDKVVNRIGDRLHGRRRETGDENVLIRVSLNMEKHPPAAMPPVPLGLSPLQVVRELKINHTFYMICMIFFSILLLFDRVEILVVFLRHS